MSKKMTPWFQSKTKPIRAGVYEIQWYFVDSWERGFSYWNGTKWANAVETPNKAYLCKKWVQGACQDKKWRGFTKEQR